MKQALFGILVSCLILSATVVACQETATPTPAPTPEPTPTPTATPYPDPKIQLHFDTIEKAEFPRHNKSHYEAREPKLVVVTNQQDVEPLVVGIEPQTRGIIAETDFENSFVIVVFQGCYGPLGNEIAVLGIWQIGGEILVKAVLKEVKIGPATPSSPYHAVRVSKVGMYRRGDFDFILMDYTGAELATTRHLIP